MHKIGFGFPRRMNVLNHINKGWTTLKSSLTVLLILLVSINLVGCGNNPPELPETPLLPPVTTPEPVKRISEVSPPPLIQKLHQSLDAYQPEVAILTPQPDQVIEDDTITVQLQVNGLPLFKDPQFGLGPHLQVILDHQPDIAVYDPAQSVTFSNLEPGTHTLRVLAVYPWDETYKNAGAFAETTFHVFTKIAQNNPNPDLPLLTYNRPQGTYGAEPILLDFYLTNAPLHIVAQENPTDEIIDWQIRATINGESFIIDRWQPLYLKGLQPGKNWVQLEYLDEQGNPVNNIYNNTARVITYDPTLNDTLSQLIKGELPFTQVRGIADPNILIQELIETSEQEQSSIVEPEVLSQEEDVTSVPTVEPEVLTEPELPQEELIPVVEPTPEPETSATEPEPDSVTEEQPITEPVPAVVDAYNVQPDVFSQPQPSKINQFFNRFRLPFFNNSAVETTPIETLPEIVEEAPIPEPTADLQPGETPNLLPEVDSLEPIELIPTSIPETQTSFSEILEAEPETSTVIEPVLPEEKSQIEEPTEPSIPALEGTETLTIPQVTTEI